ncbi:hypothetical protein BCR34DRAFT_595600 [Clohesyomyces aquaticus]|uniref:Uncharacterized protein n=1 Tax=Clohesyomyces aquaticus TaxID=1231657 RepID=A0A1Y2A9G5_9PLEO|nr:hypothetical protein BCR34DRAFT_595600 [Clohesyomyces aquaticus]
MSILLQTSSSPLAITPTLEAIVPESSEEIENSNPISSTQRSSASSEDGSIANARATSAESTASPQTIFDPMETPRVGLSDISMAAEILSLNSGTIENQSSRTSSTSTFFPASCFVNFVNICLVKRGIVATATEYPTNTLATIATTTPQPEPAASPGYPTRDR